jgi:hypothetical protein
MGSISGGADVVVVLLPPPVPAAAAAPAVAAAAENAEEVMELALVPLMLSFDQLIMLIENMLALVLALAVALAAPVVVTTSQFQPPELLHASSVLSSPAQVTSFSQMGPEPCEEAPFSGTPPIYPSCRHTTCAEFSVKFVSSAQTLPH